MDAGGRAGYDWMRVTRTGGTSRTRRLLAASLLCALFGVAGTVALVRVGPPPEPTARLVLDLADGETLDLTGVLPGDTIVRELRYAAPAGADAKLTIAVTDRAGRGLRGALEARLSVADPTRGCAGPGRALAAGRLAAPLETRVPAGAVEERLCLSISVDPSAGNELQGASAQVAVTAVAVASAADRRSAEGTSIQPPM